MTVVSVSPPKKLVHHFVFVGVLWILLSNQCSAQGVFPIERDEVKGLLQGEVNFDALSGSVLPGTPHRARLPFHGLIAATHFKGQIPFLRVGSYRPYGENGGAPASPLREAPNDRRYSWLHVVAPNPGRQDNVLASRVFVPDVTRLEEEVGFGVISLKFTNRQFAFGFDLVPLNSGVSQEPSVIMRLYDQEGNTFGQAQHLTKFGRYTWATETFEREIKGVEFVNPGQVGIGIDVVVFEIPLVMGACLVC